MSKRLCESCGDPLDVLMRKGTRFCSTRCRMRAHRAGRLPVELTSRDRWVRADGKRPITTTGRPASSTDPATWAPFNQVRRSTAGDGFGIMLGDGVACYDLDHVTDDEARRFAATIPEPVLFAERSMSGQGVHIFIGAPEAPGWRRTIDGLHVERYARARFIRVALDRFDLWG